MAVILQIMLTLFFQNKFFNKKDALNSDNSVYLLVFNLLRVVISISVSLRISDYYYLQMYIFFHLLTAMSLNHNLIFSNGLDVFSI